MKTEKMIIVDVKDITNEMINSISQKRDAVILGQSAYDHAIMQMPYVGTPPTYQYTALFMGALFFGKFQTSEKINDQNNLFFLN